MGSHSPNQISQLDEEIDWFWGDPEADNDEDSPRGFSDPTSAPEEDGDEESDAGE